MLKKTIRKDAALAQLSLEAQLLYLRAIPFQDNEGRLPGEPGAVRELAAPLLPWSDALVDQLIAEWAGVQAGGVPSPLVVRYPLNPPCRWRDRDLKLEFECRLALQFQGFRHQPSRLRRGVASSLPPPPLPELAQRGQLGPTRPNGTSVPDPALCIRARAPGLGTSPREVVLGREKLASSPAPPELPVQVEWLAAEAERCFGRTFAPLRPDAFGAASEAVDQLGRDAVTRLLVERATCGQQPKSLAWFLPALTDALNARLAETARGGAFAARPAGGLRTPDLIEKSRQLKEQRLASG